jgi:hypothetical protein
MAVRITLTQENDMKLATQTLPGVAIAAVALTAGLFAAAGPASASHGGGKRVTASGDCSQRGTYKLSAKHDDARIEVEYEVDTNRVGQTFTVRLTDNGDVIANRTVTTHGPSGSFSISKLAANRAGADTIRAHAVHGANTCGGVVHL